MDKLEDVIELLESVKNWTDPVSDEHPFGTVDYMQIDSAIEFLRGLTLREADALVLMCCCSSSNVSAFCPTHGATATGRSLR